MTKQEIIQEAEYQDELAEDMKIPFTFQNKSKETEWAELHGAVETEDGWIV